MQSRLLAITMQLAMRRQKSDAHMIYHHIRGSPLEMRLAFIITFAALQPCIVNAN